MLLREKLKDADFRLIDLAEFLQISRPTAYKFIALFERGEKDRLDKNILALFEFIDKAEKPNKMSIIDYIFKNFKDKNLGQEHLSKENKIKKDFIEMLLSTKLYDPYLAYWLECEKILKKSKKSTQDLRQLQPLLLFKDALEKFQGEKNVNA